MTAMTVLLVLSAYWQLNDPDPLVWTSIYLLGACLTLGAIMWQIPYALPLTAGALSIIGAMFIWPGITTDAAVDWSGVVGSLRMDGVGVEEVRETGGLLLQGGWLCYLGWYLRAGVRRDSDS